MRLRHHESVCPTRKSAVRTEDQKSSCGSCLRLRRSSVRQNRLVREADGDTKPRLTASPVQAAQGPQRLGGGGGGCRPRHVRPCHPPPREKKRAAFTVLRLPSAATAVAASGLRPSPLTRAPVVLLLGAHLPQTPPSTSCPNPAFPTSPPLLFPRDAGAAPRRPSLPRRLAWRRPPRKAAPGAATTAAPVAGSAPPAAGSGSTRTRPALPVPSSAAAPTMPSGTW